MAGVLFHESVFAKWRCIVVNVVFYALYQSVLDMDNLIGLVGDSAFVGYYYDGQSFFLVQFL